jgi:hypothetical protein
LASTADTQNLSHVTAGQTAAGTADAANLARLTSGQTAANSSEALQINRETGGLTSATTLAQDQSSLAAAGLDSATSSQYANWLSVQQMEWQKAGLTAQQQYQKASEYAASMGVVQNSAFNYWLSNKLGAKVPGTATPATTNAYATA